MSEQVSRAEFAGFKEELKGELNDMKSLLQRMVEAMTRLAIIDERQQAQTASSQRILERLESMEARQHAADVVAAKHGDVPSRVEQLERSVREIVVDREKDKSQHQGMQRMVRWMWAGVPTLAAVAGWAAHHGFIG